MRRFKRVVSLVLTVVLLLTLSGPYSDMYPVLAESGNDLTGWTPADEGKISGNPADGWNIGFGGIAVPANVLAYEADVDASDLQWGFDLAAFPTGCNFILGVGDKQQGFLDGSTQNVLYFVFAKSSDASFSIEGYDSKGFIGKLGAAQEVDATVRHTYGFMKNEENGNWGFAIDGAVVDEKDAYNVFMDAMSSESPGKVKLSFIPNDGSGQNLVIGNIGFSNLGEVSGDNEDETPEAAEGWTIGNASTLTGDQQNGWNLSFNAASNDPAYTTAYEAELDASKLQMSFDLSDSVPESNFILGFGDRQSNFQDANANVIYVLFGRKEGNHLNIQYFDKQNWLYEENREIDLSVPHTCGLMKINGKWVFAIDGKAACGNDAYGTFVENMAAGSGGKTRVTFTPWGGETNIKNICFTENTNDLSSWNPGVPATVTGNPRDGWRLGFWGLNFDGYTTSYDAAADISKLRMELDLSEVNAGSEFVLGFGDQQTNFPSGGSKVMYFIVTKATDTSLKLKYFNKDGVSFEEVTKEVDLSGSHQYGFCKKEGKWVFAIDGETALEGSQINAVVDALMRESAGKTRVTFTPWNAGINIRHVNFTAATEPDTDNLAGWTPGDTSTITGTPAEGWALGFYGASFPGNGSSYTSDVDVTQGKVRFNLSGLPVGKGIFLQIADARGDYSSEADTRVNFVLERKENGLFLYGLNGGPYNDHMIEGFDFEADHTFEFLQKNGQWLPALDGRFLVKDSTLKEGYDAFVRALSAKGSTVVTFVPNDGLDATETMVIKNIQIEGKDLITSGNLKGWTPGDTSTITGTPEDGWTLDFHGASFVGNGSSYTADRKLTLQKVKFNLSGLPVGKSIFLQVADARADYSVETDTRANFVLERRENGLFLYGMNGSPYNDHMIEGFDFEADHTFEFLQRNSQWLPALDGEILVKDSSLNEGYDTFVRTLADTGRTVVTFAPNDGLDATESLVIQNIRFEEKELVVSGDLTGWTPGLTSALTGNPADGWRLGFYGASFENNGSGYTSNLDVTKIKVHFNLSELADGKNIFLQVADQKGEFGNGADSRVNFVMEKPGDGSLVFYGFDSAGFGGLYNYHRIGNFDFEEDHVFEFLQRNGKWLPAIDGVVQMGDTAANEGYDAFVQRLSKAGKTVVSFAPNDGLAAMDMLVIKNIRFTEKPLVTSGDLTGWTPGATSALTGNPKSGWKLDFTGLYFEANGSSYDADIDTARLQVNFNLNDLPVGKSVFLQWGSARGSFESGTPTRVNFVLERSAGGKLVFYGMDTEGFGGLYNYHVIENFDFSRDHVFEFLLKNSRWQPAIDGVVLSGDQAANRGYDAFVKTMSRQLGERTVVSFAPNSGDDTVLTVKNIRFLQKELVSLGDLTGWTPGETTTLTGTPARGWRIDFSGLYFVDNGTSYEAGIDASRLQTRFDLSELAAGKSVILQLGSQKGSFENGAKDRINLVLERTADGALIFYGLDVEGFGGLYNYHRLDYFDFNKVHTFEFLKHSDRWAPAIDGITLTGDLATSTVYDTFVRTMSQESAGRTVVSFAPNSADDTVLTVKNINFVEKAVDATDADWVKMNGVTVTGNRDSGYDIQGKEYLTAYYRHPKKAADTTVSFQLSVEDGLWNTLALAADMGMPLLPGLEEMKEYQGTVFIFERKGENLSLQVWEGQYIYNLKTYEGFDFNGTHTLTFTNEHGNWYVVFDGEVIRSRQLNEVAEAMLKAETGVRYRFSGCYDNYRFGKVKFADTPQGAYEDSNWNVVGYEMSGSGDALSFSGNGYASWKTLVDLRQNSIEMQFKPADGGWASITLSDQATVGDARMPGLVTPEGEFRAISLILGRQNDRDLRISLYGNTPEGPAERLIGVVRSFNFDAAHKFRFVERGGRYYLALDGDVLAWPDQDKDNGYVTNALTSLLQGLNGQVYLRFLNDQAMGIQWGGIAFLNEAFVTPQVLTRGDVNATMTGSGLTLSGTGVAGLNESFDVQRDKVNIQFKPEDGNWVALTIGDTPSALVDLLQGIGNDHNMMSFILGRQDDDHLRLSLWDGEKELLLVLLRDFDFNKAHTFGFIQHRGKYYFAIDDRMIEAVAMDGDDEVVTTWITQVVSRLSRGGAYVRVGNDTGVMECSQIRLE